MAKSASQNDNQLPESEMANINEQSGSLFDEKHDQIASTNEEA